MKFREYVENNGIKVSFLAKKLNVSEPYIRMLINEKRAPSIEILVAIEELTKGKVKAKDWLGIQPREPTKSKTKPKRTSQSRGDHDSLENKTK